MKKKIIEILRQMSIIVTFVTFQLKISTLWVDLVRTDDALISFEKKNSIEIDAVPSPTIIATINFIDIT